MCTKPFPCLILLFSFLFFFFLSDCSFFSEASTWPRPRLPPFFSVSILFALGRRRLWTNALDLPGLCSAAVRTGYFHKMCSPVGVQITQITILFKINTQSYIFIFNTPVELNYFFFDYFFFFFSLITNWSVAEVKLKENSFKFKRVFTLV